MKTGICEICGKEFIRRTNKKYCSAPCVKTARKRWDQRKRHPERFREKPSCPTVGEVAAKARELGMTYGQYVAKHGGAA